ncbi:MAG: YibE/F family protein [Actinomycetota bacterium]|nr:YibE/F family protein [Actinomycetota bacterium]
MSRSLVVNVLWTALAVLIAATVIGLVTLWPSARSVEPPPGLLRPDTLGAKVVAIAATPCPSPGQAGCRRVTVELKEGKRAGARANLTVIDPPDRLSLDVGDALRVAENRLPPEAVLGGVRVDRYSLADFERRAPLAWLALAFAALVVLAGRWKGVRALVGLAASLAVVIGFVVPAILDGRSTAGVALVGSLAIMLLTLTITHGLGPKTLAASLGTAMSLVIALGLGSLFIELSHLTGLSSDEAIYLRTAVGDVSVQGLLLAGIVIAALGVLDDLTVSQASTVLALRRANPALGGRALFRSAVDVGQDHVAATVNTLVLAYAGASLPVLLIFSLGDVSFGEALNSEAVASEVVATLVGSIGLVAAVPITTAIAALLAVRMSRDALRDADAGHAH